MNSIDNISTTSSIKQKLVYILPFYEEGTDTHLFYNYKLIKESAKQAEIFVIVEKADITLFDDRQKVSYALNAPVYAQKFKFSPLRLLELVWKCFMLRVSGYRNFYVHYSYYGALAAWLATWRPSRQVRIFYWNRGMPWLYKRGWFEEKVFRFILRNTILVTGPESLAKEYQERYGVKEYRVLSNWVDIRRFAPISNFQFPISKQVLFVHHLSKRKGADLIPEIASAFSEENVKFVVAGEGSEMDNLKLEIRNLKLENTIKFLGHVPNKDIVKYFRTSHVFLMPSREEGSPHVLLEAMASGTPFVASDVGGVRELVPQGLEQFLCKSEDIKCFQNKIKTLLSDKVLYDKARAACSAHAKNFDIKRGVEEFLNLFE